ncbi:MAG: hypothetical protein DLM52_00675 [Chthoniobacterales bacterium]|nr:MAG: hypothetical protein DLM52_00675 [Chthoniobacterales bacterium]
MTQKKMIALSGMLAAVVVTASAARVEWKEYANARFGFVLSYPASLIAGREAMNGDGCEFHSPDGEFSLAAFGHFFVPGSGDSFEKRWQEELDDADATITYKRKTSNWYVVSGVTKSGTEYYHKLYRKRASWASFHITYPHAEAKKYDSWVAQIEKKFVPFREGDFDRID